MLSTKALQDSGLNQGHSNRKLEDTISPSSQRYARCEKFVKGKASADGLFFIVESSPLTKVSQQAHWRLVGKNGGECEI